MVLNILCFIKGLMMGIVLTGPSIVTHKTQNLKIMLIPESYTWSSGKSVFLCF